MWDGGRHFPFSNPEKVSPDTAAGREWLDRLEPVEARTAEFAHIDRDGEGEAFTDPMTGAPVVLLEDGRVFTAVPQRLPATSEFAELILDDPIWVRTGDGTLYLAPKDHYFGLSWGYGGSGPGSLAQLIHRLLDDITADPGHDNDGAPTASRSSPS